MKASPRCPANYYANSYFNTIHTNIFTFAQLYVKRYFSKIRNYRNHTVIGKKERPYFPGLWPELPNQFNFSRLFWLMTFLFLLPLIYTVLGSVIVAIKTARSSKYTDKLKARDERVSSEDCQNFFITILENERPGGGCTSRLFTVLGAALRSSGNQYGIDRVSTKRQQKAHQ